MKKIPARHMIYILTLSFIFGCSIKLIKCPLAISKNKWDITLAALSLGPDQYNTAGGYWDPGTGKKFAWALVKIRNAFDSERQFAFENLSIMCDDKKVRPFIIDMNLPITIKANPFPKLAPNEVISRKIIFKVPKDGTIQKFVYDNAEMAISLLQK